MEKNKIIKDENHVIFIDRLTDHHIVEDKVKEIKNSKKKKNIKKHKNK